jgi:ubiquinone/menaquinone biosynthesis C-methylase UbiE
MDALEEKLKTIEGRILDVATGRGEFLRYLADTVKAYDFAVGVDYSEKNIKDAISRNKNGLHFKIMDAQKLDFPDNYFDLAAISNSLHHLQNVKQVLKEMYRVLKPGGMLLIAEMFRDGLTEMQMTHVRLHHWWAKVDTITGISHNKTYTKAEIRELVGDFGLHNLQEIEYKDLNDQSKNEKIFNFLIEAIESYLERLKALENHEELIDSGLELKEKIKNSGIAWATQLAIWGEK